MSKHQLSEKSMDKIMPLMDELLLKGSSIRLTVTGNSMYPFLRGNKDSVELSPSDFSAIKRGDIVLVLTNANQYVLHRIVKITGESFFIAGDAQNHMEGSYSPAQLHAIVTAVWRGDKYIRCSGRKWRFLSQIWLWVFPFRCIMVDLYRVLRGIIVKLLGK